MICYYYYYNYYDINNFAIPAVIFILLRVSFRYRKGWDESDRIPLFNIYGILFKIVILFAELYQDEMHLES